MSKLGKTLAAAAVVGLSLLVAAPAQAAEVTTSCPAGVSEFKPWHLTASGTYTVSGANDTWTKAEYMLSGPFLGSKNNVNIRLRHAENGEISQNHTRWSYNSPDDRDADTPYVVAINKTVPASENEYLKFHGIFDITGPDPSCVAYTEQV
jgi:hypothetical protein